MPKPKRRDGALSDLDIAALKAIAHSAYIGMSYWDLQRELGQLAQTMSGVCTYLRADGLTVWNGKKRPTQTGKPAMVYIATSRGRKLVASLRKRGAA